jgi:hypothetical protein
MSFLEKMFGGNKNEDLKEPVMTGAEEGSWPPAETPEEPVGLTEEEYAEAVEKAAANPATGEAELEEVPEKPLDSVV